MTTKQVRNYLNELLPPTKKYSRGIKADNNLSSKEIDILCKYISDFDKQEEKFNWRSRLSDIAGVVSKYQVQEKVSTNSGGAIPKTPSAMPFLIHQVLFYIAVACDLNKIDKKPLASQANILEELSKCGISLSHNYFSRLGVTDYLNMIHYKQPVMPFNYLGQKHKELGVAVKHLVYQAGKYNTLIDVFGGSGAASVAFPRRNNSVYVYNDLDKDLCNLFDVISDDKDYITLIEYIKCLQEDLRGEREEWNPFGFDFKKETQQFYINGNSNDTDKELRIIYDLDSEVSNEIDKESIIGFMSELYDIVSKDEAYSNFMEEVFGEWNKSENPYPLIMIYFEKHSKIVNFIKENFIRLDIDNITYGEERIGMHEHQARANQLRFYEWYAICSNVLRNKSNYKVDKAFYGVATIFISQFITNGVADLSSILRIYKDSYEALDDKNGESNEWRKFLNTDFEYIITELYAKLKKNDDSLSKRQSIKANTGSQRVLSSRTIIENMDCFDLIEKYKTGVGTSKKQVYKNGNLFYLDSPYIATKQYKAGDFKTDDMRRLQEQLSGIKDKFIFSCRACKSINNGRITDEIREGNQQILKTVFDNFTELFNTSELYILTIANEKDFWNIVKSNGVAEIMITNYEIYNFSDSQYKSTSYKVYSYNDFMKELNKNINI